MPEEHTGGKEACVYSLASTVRARRHHLSICKLTIDVHTGLPADGVLELRRRVRSAGPDPLAQPTHQIFRTNAQLQVAIKGVKHLMTKTHALIAIGVEMAAGRIMTDDGYPRSEEINSMAHTSDSLPEGQ